MKLKIIKENFEPIKIEELENFEKKYGYKLPNEYKSFLLEHNGALCRNYELNFKEPNQFYEEGVAEETQEFCSSCNVIHSLTNHKYFYRTTSFYEIVIPF